MGSRKWPKGSDGLVKIPYKVPAGLSKKRRADIAKAVLEFKQKTCIRYAFIFAPVVTTSDIISNNSKDLCHGRTRGVVTFMSTLKQKGALLHWECRGLLTTSTLDLTAHGEISATNSCTAWVRYKGCQSNYNHKKNIVSKNSREDVMSAFPFQRLITCKGEAGFNFKLF